MAQLGAQVEIQVVGGRRAAIRAAKRAARELERLEQVFSVYRDDSELSRWRRGEVTEPSPEFAALMRAVLALQDASGGAFNPCVAVVAAVWHHAEMAGRLPDPDDLAAAAASIAEPRFTIDADGRPVPTGDCSMLNVNAFAKGWIVDRATEVAWADGEIDKVLVNASGDLRHRGPEPVTVAIEDPLRPYDSGPSVASVRVAGVGVATSGRAHQGYRIDGRWYGHVIDPRTGRTVDEVASVSVIAPDAATADGLATVLGVAAPAAAPTLADRLGVACLVIDADGARHANDAWREAARGG